MNRLTTLLVSAVVLTGCASTPPPADPSLDLGHREPIVVPDDDSSAKPDADSARTATPVKGTSNVARIDSGASSSAVTPHMWGPQTFDLRVVDGVWQLRIHDLTYFQGYGMSPEQMSPPRHTCTAWEPLPTDLVRSADLASIDLEKSDVVKAPRTHDAIEAWLRAHVRPVPRGPANQPASEAAFLSMTYGRPMGDC